MLSPCVSLILIFVLAGSTQAVDYVCNSVEIRKISDFQLLRNCSQVVGHVRLIDLDLTATEAATTHLSMPVEEITDYLLVYRVYGLRSLRTIFPRLMLIRGYGSEGLLYGEYSLVVYENVDLLNLGLVSLLRIQNGAVLIQSNPNLCYVHTVNWVYLLSNITQQQFYLKDNQLTSHCTLCDTKPTNIVYDNDAEYANAVAIEQHYVYRHCWDFGFLQRARPNSGNYSKCPTECGVLGCDSNGTCCSNNCLSGCSAVGCLFCASLQQEKRCVDECSSNFYEFNKSLCLSAEQCRSNGRIPYEGQCLEICPLHHRFDKDADGRVECVPECSGTFVIHTQRDLKGLGHCKTIKGSLIVELEEINSTIVMDLTHSLKNISEITGYLKVINSHQLVSLNFLQGLNTIRGESLIENKYSLYVLNNYYLETIWDRKQNVLLLKGSIFFHLNPNLCYEKIMQLQSSLKSAKDISIGDVSTNSNGERTICGDGERELEISVEDYNATAVRFKLKHLKAEDLDFLLRYVFFYKEAPEQNITNYDGRHGCGHDDWMMEVGPDRNIRYIVYNLKPNTQYAYFVMMLTKTDYHRRIAAHSEIKYFRTLPMQPTSVTKLYYNTVKVNEIMLHWWPPQNRNGDIDKYMIEVELVPVIERNRTQKLQSSFSSTNDTCACYTGDPFASGPLPNDEDYYIKPQLIYEEALPDLIYYAQPRNVTAENETSTTTTTPSTPESESESAKVSEQLRIFFEDLARGQQDTGLEDFPIVPPKPTCSTSHKSDDCQVLLQYNGTKVSGNVHTLPIQQLKPGEEYRVSVRACVANVTNGCGPQRYIYVQTVSKNLQRFLQNFEEN